MRPFSVLIAEDNDPLRSTLAEFVLERGFRAHVADNVSQALELARRVRLDFGILDLHLPDDTGLELFRAIQREIGPLPAIMVSGEATPMETDAAMTAGIFTFLRKPIAIQHLRRSMELLIEHHFPNPPGPPLR